MTIACSKCGHLITSVIIDKKLAWKECFERLSKHGLRQHSDTVNLIQQGVAKVMVATTVFMTCSELAIVPDEESFVNEHLEDLQEMIMSAAGFDADDIEEDEDEEDVEETNKEVEINKEIDTNEGSEQLPSTEPIPAVIP